MKSTSIDVIQLNFTHFLFHQGRGFVQQRPGDLSRTGGGSSHGYRIKVGVAGSSGRKRAWRFWTHIVKNQVAALCTIWNSRIQKKVQLVKEKLSNKVEPVCLTMASFRHSLEQIWYWLLNWFDSFCEGWGWRACKYHHESKQCLWRRSNNHKNQSQCERLCNFVCAILYYMHTRLTKSRPRRFVWHMGPFTILLWPGFFDLTYFLCAGRISPDLCKNHRLPTQHLPI